MPAPRQQMLKHQPRDMPRQGKLRQMLLGRRPRHRPQERMMLQRDMRAMLQITSRSLHLLGILTFFCPSYSLLESQCQ